MLELPQVEVSTLHYPSKVGPAAQHPGHWGKVELWASTPPTRPNPCMAVKPAEAIVGLQSGRIHTHTLPTLGCPPPV